MTEPEELTEAHMDAIAEDRARGWARQSSKIRANQDQLILHVTPAPCEMQMAGTCTGMGILREYPLDMLKAADTEPLGRKVQCRDCYDEACERYVLKLHGRVSF